MTDLTSSCVYGVPEVKAKWTPEAGTMKYLLERQFPYSSHWEVTGASSALYGTDATWLPNYGPGVYKYRVTGSTATLPMSVSIPQCPVSTPPPTPAPTEGFAMTHLTASCVYGVPEVKAKWTAEMGTGTYLLERQFPHSTLWEVTGASNTLSGTDATWLPNYGPGVYKYRVTGNTATYALNVTIPQCPK
jgi:hypothetical protein